MVALFLLAVLASSQNLTVGLAQSVLLLAVALAGVRFFRKNREGLLKAALTCIVSGALLRTWANPYSQLVSDSLIALAVTGVAVYILGPPLVRLVRRVRSGVRGGAGLFTRTAFSGDQGFAVGSQDVQLTPAAQWMPFFVGLFVILILVVFGSGKVVGLSAAALQWNSHLFTSDLLRAGGRLIDPNIAFAGATFVAVPDSLVLWVLKMIGAGAWPAFASNLLTLFSVGLFIVASIRFLQQLSFGWAASVGATVLFLLLPVGMEMRFAAPFDLSIALLALLPALSGRGNIGTFLAAAFLSGVCNTANGYEFAVLLIVLRGFNLTKFPARTATYVFAAALAIVGSIVCSLLVGALAPSVSLREAWWYAQEIPRIVWSDQLSISWPAIVLFAAAAAAGIYAMLRARVFRLLWPVCALAIVSGVLAVPTSVGGVPLISPAHILRLIAPAGWPTARFVELLAFALTVPAAYTISLVLAALSPGRPKMRTGVVWVSAAFIFIMCLPSAHLSAVPRAAAGTAVVEFPIAEAGSRAGVLYAEDLLAARARVLQPLIFVDLPDPLPLRSSPTDPSTVRTMRGAQVRFIVLRSDIYAQPGWRTVEPQLYDPAFSAEPAMAALYPWKIVTYTPPGQGT